jgi:hypothetical protein
MPLRMTPSRALALGVMVTVAASSSASCRAFSLPGEACHPEEVSFAHEVEGRPLTCTTCLEARCCDAVGRCERIEGCGETVKDVHGCLLDGGLPRVNEPICKPRLSADEDIAGAATQTYDCMEARCGVECGLPVCRLGQNVPGIVNSRCDRCIESKCCEVIDVCGDNRSCKAALDCILTTECAAELAGAMGTLETGAVQALERAVCGNEPAPGGTPACIEDCLDRFTPAQAKGGTEEDQRALCAVFQVYACSLTSDCGEACRANVGASDAGDGG